MIERNQQGSTCRKIISHKNLPLFVLYSITCMLYGQVISCLGPLIPYLAAHQNRQQTYYADLFVGRSIGYFVGAVFFRFTSRFLSYHQLISTGLGLVSIASILFDLTSDLFLRNVCMFVSALGFCIIEGPISLAGLISFKGENISKWMQGLYGFYGIGGLVVPFVVYFFQLQTMSVLGLLSIVVLVFFFFFKSPQLAVDKDENEEQQATRKTKPFPLSFLILFSSLCLFLGGQQATYGGWISSYAVLNNFSTKQHATLYPSIYWISVTFFRFSLTIISGSSSSKIRNMAIIAILSTFLNFYLIFQVNHQLGLMVMTVLYGFSYSILIPLFFTIPEQFGYTLTVKQASVVTLISSCSGYLAVLVGKMMEWFTYNWLLYGMGLMNLVVVVIMIVITNLFKKKERELELDHLQQPSISIETKTTKSLRNEENQ